VISGKDIYGRLGGTCPPRTRRTRGEEEGTIRRFSLFWWGGGREYTIVPRENGGKGLGKKSLTEKPVLSRNYLNRKRAQGWA